MGQTGGINMNGQLPDGRIVLFPGDILPSGDGNPRTPMERVAHGCDGGCCLCNDTGFVWVSQATTHPFAGISPDKATSAIQRVLSQYQFSCSSEARLQDHIHGVLVNHYGAASRREESQSAENRPDFMVGRIAVEVKCAGSLAALTRQVFRYAQLDSVDGVVVVASLRRLLALPSVMNGKPVVPVFVGRPF